MLCIKDVLNFQTAKDSSLNDAITQTARGGSQQMQHGEGEEGFQMEAGREWRSVQCSPLHAAGETKARG